ncbi:subtilisin-like protease sdd1 [Phtheirospermum japonicum]|uniref:Subtilisin-like protease sdd1 n=1 Tax=Phtheirospermum japonicum TaxID=374723 RepID=A0A830D318_9LAMI|nr:subtilisin-like protease sdd1 [Phtheirospermum japonicum]
MLPPPAKWKGKCEFPNKTDCNNKLIGARLFNRAVSSAASILDEETVVDQKGHGTHTASTAAGAFVENACYFGSACGTAVGMAPRAHLAIYKVCTKSGCSDINVLAGLDAAIEDGVDVISMSLSHESIPFHDDHLAIATFAAVKKGIFVSCSGGNKGPFKKSIRNEAAWILTVGASTIDRSLRATAKLGDAQEFDGESVYQQKDFPDGTMLPLVYRASCAGNTSLFDVEGKVVLCDGSKDISHVDQGWEVNEADPHFLPATEVSYMAGQKIKAYINSTDSPTATILFGGTVIGDPLAPTVTSFSSRGPSLQTPGILKPDIMGPGTPHLAGVAALLKSAHPNWSPAAIKSAIMTTAGLLNAGKTAILDEKHTPADVFATGAGHVDPSKAADPGLVYDLESDDYILYICASQTFTRTVTNVGEPFSYYFVRVVAPKGVRINVKPRQLWFWRVGQKATYRVTFSRCGKMTTNDTYSQGYLQWVSNKHKVRSVISVMFTGGGGA